MKRLLMYVPSAALFFALLEKESGNGRMENKMKTHPATGGLVWSVPVDGLPNDLLVP